MAYKQKSSPFNHVNSWEEEDVKRGRKLEKEGKKGHAEALFIDAHDSNRWRGGKDGSEPLHMSNQLSEGGDVIDETAQRSGSFMSKHTQSGLNYGSPLHVTNDSDNKISDAKVIIDSGKENYKTKKKTLKETKKTDPHYGSKKKKLKEDKKLDVKAGRDLKKEGRKLRRNERTVKEGERQLKDNLAANQAQIDKDKKSKELTVDPIDDGNIGNVTGKTKTKTKTKSKTVTRVDGKRTVVKDKTKNKNKNKNK